MYLNPKKGIPSWRSLPVKAIIGSKLPPGLDYGTCNSFHKRNSKELNKTL